MKTPKTATETWAQKIQRLQEPLYDRSKALVEATVGETKHSMIEEHIG
jgi:hypothetical protein